MADDQDPILRELDPTELVRTIERPDVAARLRTLAAKELTRRDLDAATPLLARVLRDETAPADLRSVAAVALGKQPGAEHEAALSAALAAREPLVVRRAAEALGKIGGREALAALRRVPVPDEPAAARALGFAKSFIAYRLGLDEELLSAPPPAPLRGEGAPLVVGPASAQLKAEVAERLPRELPAVEVRVAAAVRVACERQELVVLPTTAPARLLRSSAVAAVVMKRAHSLGHFATHLYVLSHRAGSDRLALRGVRPDGTITHTGEAWQGDGGLRFKLEALATPYADPMRIEGSLDADGAVTITEARAATAPRSPLPAPRKSDAPALPHPLVGKAPPFQARVKGKH